MVVAVKRDEKFSEDLVALARAHAAWGDAGGWDAEVLWVYNERVPAWESR